MTANGLPYTIQESLQYKVPCIVSDVGGNTELIKDGINGYIVPLDMKFDINKIKKIPKCKEYDNHAKEKWLEYLGGGIYIDKKEEEINMKYVVEATSEYVKNNITDSERGDVPVEGTRWEVSQERMELLSGLNEKGIKYVNVISAVQETAKKKIKKERAVRKTVKKTK